MTARKLRFSSITRRLLASALGVGAFATLAGAVPWAAPDKIATTGAAVTMPWSFEDKFGTAGEGEFVPWGPKDRNRNAGKAKEFREVPMQQWIENLPASKELPAAPRPLSVPAVMKDVSANVTPGDTSWTFVGPAPIPNGQTQGRVDPVSGRVTAIAIDPTDANISYVGTAQGGLYRTTDGGATWLQMMDNATVPSFGGGTPLAIGAITIDPTDRTRVFVGTGEGNLCIDCYFGTGLYIITDANGATPMVNGPYNAASGNDPAGGVAAGANVFIGRSINAIAVDSNDPNNVFVATGSGSAGIRAAANSSLARRGIYRSTNARSANPTWTRIQVTGTTSLNTIATSLVIEPGNANNLVASFYGQSAADPTGYYRSTNALATTPTFTQTLALPTFTNAKLVIQKNVSTNVVTVYGTADQPSANTALDTGSGTLYKSVDGGANFVRLTTADGFAGGQGFFNLAVGVDPNNANNVSVGGQQGNRIFRKSNDGGATFIIDDAIGTGITRGLHADTHSIVYAATPADGSVIYHGNDGGVWRSADAGNSWASRNTAGFSATQFQGIALHPTDPNFTISGSQDNGTEQLRPDRSIFRVDFGDGGYSLIDQNAPNTTDVVQYHTYFNSQNALIGTGRVLNNPCAQEGQWSFHGIYGGAVDPFVYCDGTTDTFNGIAITDNVQFYAPMTLGPGNPNTWYFGTDKLYRSADRADTGAAVSAFLGDFVNDISVSPQDDNVRIVGTNGSDGTGAGSVWATTTGAGLVKIAGTGATNGPSSLVSTAPSTAPITRVAMDPNNKNVAYVAVGGFGTSASPRPHLFRVSNLDNLNTGGAVSFTAVSNGLPDVPISSIAIDPQSGSATRSSRDIYVGTDLGVYKSADGGANWSKYLDGFPRVAVFGLAIQNPSRIIRAATHGRGWYDAPVTASAPIGPQLTAASSRKSHGAAGTFDVNMPLTGPSGVEPRRGASTTTAPGDFTIVLRFTNTLANAGAGGAAAVFTPGAGKSGQVNTISSNGSELIVTLTNVSDVQTGSLTVSNVQDADGMTLSSATVPLGFNIGDTNGNRTVDNGDVIQTKAQSGKTITNTNFRTDVTANGFIDGGDVIVVKNKAQTSPTIP